MLGDIYQLELAGQATYQRLKLYHCKKIGPESNWLN